MAARVTASRPVDLVPVVRPSWPSCASWPSCLWTGVQLWDERSYAGTRRVRDAADRETRARGGAAAHLSVLRSGQAKVLRPRAFNRGVGLSETAPDRVG